jgi:hypothetical protein
MPSFGKDRPATLHYCEPEYYADSSAAYILHHPPWRDSKCLCSPLDLHAVGNRQWTTVLCLTEAASSDCSERIPYWTAPIPFKLILKPVGTLQHPLWGRGEKTRNRGTRKSSGVLNVSRQRTAQIKCRKFAHLTTDLYWALIWGLYMWTVISKPLCPPEAYSLVKRENEQNKIFNGLVY